MSMEFTLLDIALLLGLVGLAYIFIASHRRQVETEIEELKHDRRCYNCGNTDAYKLYVPVNHTPGEKL